MTAEDILALLKREQQRVDLTDEIFEKLKKLVWCEIKQIELETF